MRVFAYGSLLWNPGFVPEAIERGVLLGWRRRWCVESRLHRGTHDRPGAVLGLIPGGKCTGLVYSVRQRDVASVEAYLDQRELCEAGYAKTTVEVDTPSGRKKAIAYVAETDPYAVDLRKIMEAVGTSGTNLEYAIRTFDALDGLIEEMSEAEVGLCETSVSTLRQAAAICGSGKLATRRLEDGVHPQIARQQAQGEAQS